jgi:elongation factor G
MGTLKEYSTSQIRNVALAGHTSSGKTSLVEALLHHLKVTDRLLAVDDGNSVSDYDPEEVRRKTSIATSILPAEYGGCKINVLDLPGYRDFIGEIKNAIRVADAVLLAVDGTSGAEVGTELAWEYADEYALPRVAFVNKLDKERSDFGKTLESLKDTFGVNCVPLTLPVGHEASFSGVVDVLRMKLVKETPTQKPQYTNIPGELAEAAEQARAALVEAAAEGDDALTEKFLEDQPLTEEEIARGLKLAFHEGRFLPVLCGSALKEIGITPLLEFIVSCVPAPNDRKPFAAHKADSEEAVERPIDPNGPAAAFVFKTVSDDYAGKLTFFKVLSGAMTSDSSVLNPRERREERISHLLVVRGKKQEDVHKLVAGDIGAVAKLSVTTSSDTLCAPNNPIVYEPTVLPPRTYSMAVVTKSKADEEKVGMAMHRLIEQDAMLEIRRDPEIRQTIISGMGDTHLDVALARMKAMSKLEIELEIPRVPYHETITRKGAGSYRHKKQTGGRGQFAEVHMRVEPLPEGSEFEFEWEVVGGNIPTKFKPSVEKGIVEALERGIIAGYKTVDVKAICHDGKHHEVDSSDMAFKIAASMGFRQIARECTPIILEPIYNVKIVIPEAFLGDIMGDISGRRGKILGSESRGKKTEINAQVPLAEMFTYTQDLRSMTQGRGSFEMTFSHYERVPGDLQAKIVEATQKRKEEGEE